MKERIVYRKMENDNVKRKNVLGNYLLVDSLDNILENKNEKVLKKNKEKIHFH